MPAISSTDDNAKHRTMGSGELLGSREKRMTLEISPQLHTRLKAAAAMESMTIREIAIEAFNQWLKEHKY